MCPQFSVSHLGKDFLQGHGVTNLFDPEIYMFDWWCTSWILISYKGQPVCLTLYIIINDTYIC